MSIFSIDIYSPGKSLTVYLTVHLFTEPYPTLSLMQSKRLSTQQLKGLMFQNRHQPWTPGMIQWTSVLVSNESYDITSFFEFC